MWRLYEVRIAPDERLVKLEKHRQNRTTAIVPKRGDIYDRNLEELAITKYVDSVFVNPRKFNPTAKQLQQLSFILELPVGQIAALQRRTKQFAWLKRKISESAATEIKAMAVPGVGMRKEARRYYPNGGMAAQLVGFVDYNGNGAYGIERYFDKALRGEEETVKHTRDALGRVLYDEQEAWMRNSSGRDLILTIDKNIQHIAEQELSAAAEKYGATGGLAIAMEPSSGVVLALANYPGFDPNTYTQFDREVWRNKALTDSFEPGSTFKIFTLAAALQEGQISPKDLIYCEDGKASFGKTLVHDVHPYKWLTISEVIQYSSNIGAVKIAQKLGRERFISWIRKFGFGETTLRGYPGEAPGNIKPAKSWDLHQEVTSSFGQGIATTGMQLVAAFSSVVNGGYRVAPVLVKDPDQKQAYQGAKILGDDTVQFMKQALVDAIEKDGTGRLARIDGYIAGGKTGTAQKFDSATKRYSDSAYIASFIGFAPLANPRLAILVMLDSPKNGYYGGTVAAPAFSRIAAKTLTYLHVPQDGKGKLPNKSSEQLAAVSAENSGRNGVVTDPNAFPDLTGKTLREVLRLFPNHDVKAKGSGFVIQQTPKRGARMDKVQAISLLLSEDRG